MELNGRPHRMTCPAQSPGGNTNGEERVQHCPVNPIISTSLLSLIIACTAVKVEAACGGEWAVAPEPAPFSPLVPPFAEYPLRDVAVIEEQIWAVGWMEEDPDSQVTPLIARWNGTAWDLFDPPGRWSIATSRSPSRSFSTGMAARGHPSRPEILSPMMILCGRSRASPTGPPWRPARRSTESSTASRGRTCRRPDR